MHCIYFESASEWRYEKSLLSFWLLIDQSRVHRISQPKFYIRTFVSKFKFVACAVVMMCWSLFIALESWRYNQ